jgi:hypothetical protein
MPYLIQSNDFGKPVYFMEHEGDGFSISTDRKLAKIHSTLTAATVEAKRLQEVTGLLTQVKKK